MGYIYDYSKLKGRITEKVKNQALFAEKIGLSKTTLYAKLTGKIEFKQSEIMKACQILDISGKDIQKYFFSIIS